MEPKTVPRGVQKTDSPRLGRQDPREAPKSPPRGFQEASRRSQDAPKTAEEPPKRGRRRPKGSLNKKTIATREADAAAAAEMREKLTLDVSFEEAHGDKAPQAPQEPPKRPKDAPTRAQALHLEQHTKKVTKKLQK